MASCMRIGAALLLALALLAQLGTCSSVDERIYARYVNEGYCIRLLHQTGWIGCGLGEDGTQGRLRVAMDDVAVQSLVASPPSYSVALVLPETLLRASTLRLLTSTPGLKMAGVLVLPPEPSSPGSHIPVPPPGGYSPAPSAPQHLPYIPSQPAIPNRPARSTQFNNSYQWNPMGDGSELMRFEMGIATLTAAEQSYILQLARENEEDERDGNFVSRTTQFFYHMYAEESSVKCLEDATCMPVGGQSVWGALGNLTRNSSTNPVPLDSLRPIVLATTKIDSGGFFHQLAPGADESQASIVVLVAAIKALALTPGIASLPSQILFALFNGETFSHVGSRKFVDDIQHFECTEYNWGDESGTGADCTTPYKNRLEFLNVHLEKIEKIVEVGMIGANETVFLHRQRDGNTVTDAMMDTVRSVAANLVSACRTDFSQTVSAQAFLDAKESIGVLVLTDHAGPYANKFLHSRYDSAGNLMSDLVPGSNRANHALLCSKATLLARTLWIEAGGDVDGAGSIEADCALLNDLLYCLVEDYNCPLIQSIAPNGYLVPADGRVLSHYAGVYQLIPERFVAEAPLFLHDLLYPWVLNASGWEPAPAGHDGPWPRAPRNIHVHDAVDPNLVFDEPANRWRIKPDANDFPLWTESNWDSGVGFRTFRVEDPAVEVAMFVAGILVAVACVVGVLAGQRYCNKKFKTT